MHALSLLALFVGSSLAVPSPLTTCLNSNAAMLAAFSDCADQGLLAHCLSGLDTHAHEYVESCLVEAGCAASDAASDAEYVLARCHDMTGPAAQDLKKRYQAVPNVAARQDNDDNDDDDNNDGDGRDAERASASSSCYTSSAVSTNQCSHTTQGGIVSSFSCTQTTVSDFDCKPGKTCSHDSQGIPICMDLEDDLDVAGIIIAIVFAVIIVIGIATLTYLCCKDNREQKRLRAKAEAVSLARAETKKKRAAEVRQPLMAQSEGPPPPGASAMGGGDPFNDQHRQ